MGASTTTCDGTIPGAMRWSTTNTCMESCNGTAWNCLQYAPCATSLPAAFTYTDQTGVATNTLISSNIVQITGIAACTVEVSITGSGSPQYRVCSDAACTTVVQDWTVSRATLTNNQYVQLRLTSSVSGNFQHPSTVTVGARSSTWNVTTIGNCTDPTPAVGTYCADGTVYVGNSPDGATKMYTTPCYFGRIWNGSACAGNSTQTQWSNTATVSTGLTSSITGESNTTTMAGLANADSPYHAAILCFNLVYAGQSDWYLPAQNEATLLITSCGLVFDIGCTDGSNNWTSTESTAVNARYWRSNNSNGAVTKLTNMRVRCVRKD